jgi:glutamate racemase
MLVAKSYIGHLSGDIETAILGCTHYPLLASVIQRVLPGTTLVDSAAVTAAAVRDALGPGSEQGSIHFLVTDHVTRFKRVGELFLGEPPLPVEWVDLPTPQAPFAELEDTPAKT